MRPAKQVRQDQPGQVDRGIEIDRDLASGGLPIFGIGQHRVPLDAGVVDEHVQGGKLARGPIDQGDAFLVAGHVADPCDDARVCLGQLAEPLFAPAADQNLAARANEALGERQADARSASSHEDGIGPQLPSRMMRQDSMSKVTSPMARRV